MSARHPALEMLLSADAGLNAAARAGAQDLTSSVPGQCLLVTHQCQMVPDMCLFIGPRWQHELPENWPLSLCAWAWHQSRRRSPFSSCSATPLWDNHIWMCQIFLQVLPLTSSSRQSPELGVDSRSTVIKRGLVPSKWLFWQPQACPCCSAVQSFLLFALTVVSLSLYLCLPHVITWTDEKTLLGINTFINLLRIWFWSI